MTASIEQEIAERIAAAKIRLRFDRVVRWLANDLKTELAEVVPDGQTVLFTITAPIKVPRKTASALAELARTHLSAGDFHGSVHANKVRMRRVSKVPPPTPRVITLVHNQDADGAVILKLAESHLLQTS